VERALQGSETHVFPCQRWLAKDEDDGAIERELVADKVLEEVVRRDGSVKTKELQRRNTLLCNYAFCCCSHSFWHFKYIP